MKAVIGVKHGTDPTQWSFDDLAYPLIHPRESTPAEFEERELFVFRDEESSEIFVSEGIRIERENGQSHPPRYRVETDKGEVVRIVREESGAEIPLATQTARRIVRYHAETRDRTQVNGLHPRFHKIPQPPTV